MTFPLISVWSTPNWTSYVPEVCKCMHVEQVMVCNYCHAHTDVCTHTVHYSLEDNTRVEGLWLYADGLQMFSLNKNKSDSKPIQVKVVCSLT